MSYITRKRFKKICICGELNLPFNTECQTLGNVIIYNNSPICFTTSQDAYDYFVNNEDNQGLKRAELVNKILKLTSSELRKYPKKEILYNNRWNKIWSTSFMQKYKRADHNDVWLWNYDFYNASIEELEKIYDLIK